MLRLSHDSSPVSGKEKDKYETKTSRCGPFVDCVLPRQIYTAEHYCIRYRVALGFDYARHYSTVGIASLVLEVIQKVSQRFNQRINRRIVMDATTSVICVLSRDNGSGLLFLKNCLHHLFQEYHI